MKPMVRGSMDGTCRLDVRILPSSLLLGTPCTVGSYMEHKCAWLCSSHGPLTPCLAACQASAHVKQISVNPLFGLPKWGLYGRYLHKLQTQARPTTAITTTTTAQIQTTSMTAAQSEDEHGTTMPDRTITG